MPSLDPIEGALGVEKASHLLRRATFGPTKTQVNSFSSLTVQDAMQILFEEVELPEPPVDLATGETWLNPASGGGNSEQDVLMKYFMSWHLEQMRTSGVNAKEKITLFFHSHLPTRWSIIQRSEAVYYQNALFRHFAFGSFKEMFSRICRDNAMLVYLDGNDNVATSPNENFAREMFELYSIGRGDQIEAGNYSTYTEDDIKAATRVLTGYKNDETFSRNIDVVTGLPLGYFEILNSGGVELVRNHDVGEKVFSQSTFNRTISPAEVIDGLATKESAEQEFDDLMDMIFSNIETARFLCRKLYRFFVYHKIDESVEINVIQPLAQVFFESDYSMRTVMETLFSSKHFYDNDNETTSDDVVGSVIKSPIDLIMGTLRFFETVLPSYTNNLSDFYEKSYENGILRFIEMQGMDFYEPFEVAGYPAYHQFPAYHRNWITPNNLARRYQFASLALAGIDGEMDFGFKLDILAWVENASNISDPSSASEIVNTLINSLFPFEIGEERRSYFLNDIFLDGLYEAAYTAEWNAYQSSGNGDTVTNMLNSLVSALLQTPEYQLM